MISKLRTTILTGTVLLILFPFVFMILLSLSSNWVFPDILPQYFGLKNWNEILGSESSLLWSLFISILISLSVALSSTLMGFILSRAVSQHPSRNLLTLITYFPYVLAPVVFGVCLSYYFLRIGIFGTVAGVIIAQFMIAFPYALIFFMSFWSDRTKNLEELVKTLGGNSYQAFIKVLFPMAKGMLLVCFFQTFLISWFEYGLTSVIGVGKVQTLTIKVFLYITESNFYYGAISCCMLIFPPILLLYFNKRYVFNKIV